MIADETVRLEHAFLTVRDASRSVDFYRQLFPSWAIRWKGAGESGGRWLHFGLVGKGQPPYLSLYEDPSARAPADAYASTGIAHVGFAHPDVDELTHRLGAVGIHPTLRRDDGLYRRVYYADPDGIEVEFVQELKERPGT